MTERRADRTAIPSDSSSAAPAGRPVVPVPGGVATMLNKVPQVTLLFWVVKICSTTVGETGADFLNDTLGFGLTGTTLVAAAVLAAGLVAQFAVRRYVPAIYWLNVVVISVVGTLFSDNLVDGWGVPLAVSTLVFAIGLAIAFAAIFAAAVSDAFLLVIVDGVVVFTLQQRFVARRDRLVTELGSI